MATNVSHRLPTPQAQAIADLTGYEDAATLRWQQACVQAANTLTALPNGRYVNVRMERMRQGLELAQRGAVTLPEEGEDLSAVVRSGNNVYQVDTRLLTCTCADYQKHLQACKHLLAVEVHLGALGLVAPVPPAAVPEEPAAPEPAPIVAPEPRAACPTAATWPTSEAPASMNVQLKIGNMQLMYTARDTNDRDLQDRMTKLLPWLAEVMAACEANYKARQQAEEQAKATPPTPPAPPAPLAPASSNNSQSPQRRTAAAPHQPTEAERLASAHDHDPGWCPKPQVTMRWHDGDARGPGWFRHQLADGSYCKGN